MSRTGDSRKPGTVGYTVVNIHMHSHQEVKQVSYQRPKSQSQEKGRPTDDSGKRKEVTCFHCHRKGHKISDCHQLQQEKKAESKDVTCFHCQHKGHKTSDCRQLKQHLKAESKDVTCFHCHRKGHHIDDCHQLKQEKKALSTTSGSQHRSSKPTQPTVPVSLHLDLRQEMSLKLQSTKPKGPTKAKGPTKPKGPIKPKGLLIKNKVLVS